MPTYTFACDCCGVTSPCCPDPIPTSLPLTIVGPSCSFTGDAGYDGVSCYYGGDDDCNASLCCIDGTWYFSVTISACVDCEIACEEEDGCGSAGCVSGSAHGLFGGPRCPVECIGQTFSATMG